MKYYTSKSGEWAVGEADRTIVVDGLAAEVVTPAPVDIDGKEMKEVSRTEMLKSVPKDLHDDIPTEKAEEPVGKPLEFKKVKKTKKRG